MGAAAESKFYAYLIVPSVTYFRNVKTKSKGFLTEDSFLRAASTREEALSIQNYIKTEYGVKTKLIPLLINLGAGAEFDVDTTRILNIRDNDSPNLYEALQYRGDTMTIQNKEVPIYEIAPVSILSDQIRDIEELLEPYDKIEDVNQKIDDVIAAAPEALDTLNEIAQSLADDADFAGTMTLNLSLKANDADISAVGYSGEYIDILNPPTKVSHFENDSNYLTDVSENHVTQHQDAINIGVRITESQITNLKNYLLIGDLDPYAKTTYVNTEIADVVKEFDTSTHYLNNIKLRPAVEKLDDLISSINLNITDITKAFDANTNYLNELELRPAIKKLDEIINPIQTTIFNSDGTTVLNYAAVNQVVSEFNDTENGFSSIQSLTDHLRTTLLDSEGNRITDLEAINTLRQELYNNTDGSITLLQQDITSLTTDLTRSDGSRLNVSVVDSLSSAVNDSETGLEAAHRLITELSSGLTDEDGNPIVDTTAVTALEQRLFNNGEGVIDILQSLTTTLTTNLTLPDNTLLQATAVDQLSSAVNHSETGLAAVNLKIATLSQGLTDEDGNPIVDTSAVDILRNELYHDSDGDITVINEKVTSLETTLLDANGNAIVNTSAVDQLRSELFRDDETGAIDILNEKVTSLESSLENADGTEVSVAAFNALSSAVNDSETGLTAVNESITSLESVLTDPDGNPIASASALHQLITNISDDGSASAQYALELNANNHISGIYLNNDGTRSDFSVVANQFKIFNDSSNPPTSKPAFEVSDGEVYLKDIKVDSANIESLTVKNLEGDINVITPFSGSGSRTWGPTSEGYKELVQVELPKNGVSGVSHIPTINMVFSGLFATDPAFIKLSMSKSSENYNTWHQIQIMRHKTAGSGNSWTVIPISGSWGVPLEEDVKFKVEVQMKNDKGTGSTNKSKTATNYWSGTVMGLVGSVSDEASTDGSSVDISQATEYGVDPEDFTFDGTLTDYINSQVTASTQPVVAEFDYSSIFTEYGIDFTTDDNTYIP